MLTANQLRQVAGRSGARDIGNVEIDVILTYLLQLFSEKGIMDHVGFKGGTMCEKWSLVRAAGFQPISISHAIRISPPRI